MGKARDEGRLKLWLVSKECLLALIQGAGQAITFTTEGLPTDAEFIDVHWSDNHDAFIIKLSHPSWPVHQPGTHLETIPLAELKIRTIPLPPEPKKRGREFI